jgi:hypothetical protein
MLFPFALGVLKFLLELQLHFAFVGHDRTLGLWDISPTQFQRISQRASRVFLERMKVLEIMRVTQLGDVYASAGCASLIRNSFRGILDCFAEPLRLGSADYIVSRLFGWGNWFALIATSST